MLEQIAVLDASVLYPAPLRDTLLQLAAHRAYQPRVSQQIHDEWLNALLRNRPKLNRQKLERTRELINSVDENCLVVGYEPIIGQVSLPDKDDRHVLAVAIHAKASIIITNNLKHFPEKITSTYNVTAVSPDNFICSLINEDRNLVCQALREQRIQLRNPPKSVPELLETLKQQGLKVTVNKLDKYATEL